MQAGKRHFTVLCAGAPVRGRFESGSMSGLDSSSECDKTP
jgi:hypothetical protein